MATLNADVIKKAIMLYAMKFPFCFPENINFQFDRLEQISAQIDIIDAMSHLISSEAEHNVFGAMDILAVTLNLIFLDNSRNIQRVFISTLLITK